MKKLVVLIFLIGVIKIANAQSDVIEYLKAGTEDAGTLIQPYLNPFASGLGDGLNNGWYYTAETHKRLGFDFSVSVSAVKVPGSAKSYDLSQLSFNNIRLADPADAIAPTIAGDEMSGPQLYLLNPNDPNETIGSFYSPQGLELDIIPVPVAQLGIGLLPHTDVLVRYVPKLKFNEEGDDKDETQVGLFGLGVKHSFKDWIPAIKHLPFDAAVFASFSNITAQSGINFTPADYGVNDPDYVQDDNQQLDIETSTVKFGLIVSKKVAFITFFGGIGNSQSKSDASLTGRYPIVNDYADGEIVLVDLVDPVKLKFESSNISLDAGLRLKMAFFNIFASINKAEYTSFNAGVSLSVR